MAAAAVATQRGDGALSLRLPISGLGQGPPYHREGSQDKLEPEKTYLRTVQYLVPRYGGTVL